MPYWVNILDASSHSAFSLGAETSAGSFFGIDVQPQFVTSLVRLALTMGCVGMVWLLSNSSILTERKRNAAIIAGIAYFLAATTAELAFVHLEIYRYTFTAFLYQGVPLDVELCYACLWGTGLCLLAENAWPLMRPLLLLSVVALTVIFDQWGMRSGMILSAGVKSWMTYSVALHALLPCLALLCYWMVGENHGLTLRSALYSLGYFSVFYFLVPSLILNVFQGDWSMTPQRWQAVIVALAIAAIPGAWAAGQFASSGRGTPLPLDPTTRLITTGPFAYVRNPMQLSCILITAIWALGTESLALGVYALALAIVMQLVRNHEEDDLHRRFGTRYKQYCRKVWLWFPHLMPYEED